MGRTIVRVQAIDQAPDLTPAGIVPVGIPGATREGIGRVGIQAAIARVETLEATLAGTVPAGMLEGIHLAETPAAIDLAGMLEAIHLGEILGETVREGLLLEGILEPTGRGETPGGIARAGLLLAGMLEAIDLERVEGRAVRQLL